MTGCRARHDPVQGARHGADLRRGGGTGSIEVRPARRSETLQDASFTHLLQNGGLFLAQNQPLLVARDGELPFELRETLLERARDHLPDRFEVESLGRPDVLPLRVSEECLHGGNDVRREGADPFACRVMTSLQVNQFLEDGPIGR
jgi:hypothetical protein